VHAVLHGQPVRPHAPQHQALEQRLAQARLGRLRPARRPRSPARRV